MSPVLHREPDSVGASSRVAVSHELQHPAARVRGRSIDVHRTSVDGQRASTISRNPSIDSNPSTASGYRLVSDRSSGMAHGPTLPMPVHRSSSVDAALLRPPSVNHAQRPAFTQPNTAQRSGMPHTLTSNPPTTVQGLPMYSQRRPESSRSSVGPTQTGLDRPRPTGTVIIASHSFLMLTGS